MSKDIYYYVVMQIALNNIQKAVRFGRMIVIMIGFYDYNVINAI